MNNEKTSRQTCYIFAKYDCPFCGKLVLGDRARQIIRHEKPSCAEWQKMMNDRRIFLVADEAPELQPRN